jgi:hypothetical protein
VVLVTKMKIVPCIAHFIITYCTIIKVFVYF